MTVKAIREIVYNMEKRADFLDTIQPGQQINEPETNLLHNTSCVLRNALALIEKLVDNIDII